MSRQPEPDCKGCIPMLVETLALVSLFFIALLSTVYPLIAS